MITGNNKDWWKHTTIYEVYIRSFKDSNGDGVGDLKGIQSKLDHFEDLGIETVWITPFYKSPMNDLGYDVMNYTDIDPLYGTMEDFDELLNDMNERGLKLIVDFVINHSSDQHPWFKKSIDRIEPYTDFYVWANPKGFDESGNPLPPNDWLSIFGGCAWKWNSKRKQFYLHQFAEKQPDFNLRNSALKAELKRILKFWLDKGAVGARLDATKHFIEDLELRDEPLLKKSLNKTIITWYDIDHRYTLDLWESYEFIHELRDFVDRNCSSTNDEKILITEAYTDFKHTIMYYGKQGYNIAHFPFNFGFFDWTSFPSPRMMDTTIKRWLKHMPKNGVANWQIENHDNFRVGNRFSIEFMDIMTMTILTLPGIACIYYGQEIGMMDHNVRPDQIRDPNNNAHIPPTTRDLERLPMQWDDSLNAGRNSHGMRISNLAILALPELTLG
ncbi:hypothetical protein V9T40_000118 [Parthenolecanium corni]|uniref:alpha-glucosidase n=1 Tax=Parthenolecanium corni TaxID=536013 RepID=A0AAN9TE14_9HEMI